MNVFDLAAKVTLDTSDAERKIPKVGAAMKKGLANAAKIAAAGITAASVALASLTKNAVKAYAEFEQLEGGVKKIFGDDAAKIVMQNAENAFKTAGMSANEYMETATSFSASLIKSLKGDTVKAAQYADMAITDMADNANTFGTSMDSIKAAYAGFAKGNFTMLDNLKLGYGGTKSEMERLIKDAQKLDKTFKAHKKKNGELKMSYDDIVKAIHIVQENMGIAGTTQKEAALTIQGALYMTKAAWANLLTALGKGKGVNKAMKALTESAKILVKNVLPVVKRVLRGVANMIKEIAPVIIEYIPELVETILPALLSAAAKLVAAVIKSIPGLLKALYKVLLTFLDSLEQWLEAHAPGLAKAFKKVRETVKNTFKGIAQFWTDHIQPAIDYITGTLVPAIKQAWEENIEPITAAWAEAIERISAAWDSIKEVLQPVIDKITDYVEEIKKATEPTDLVAAAVDLLAGAAEKLAGFVGDVAEGFAKFVKALDEGGLGDSLEGIKDAINRVRAAFVRIKLAIQPVIDKIVEFFNKATEGYSPIQEIAKVVLRFVRGLKRLAEIVATVMEKLAELVEWLTSGGMAEAIDGLKQKWEELKDNLSTIVDDIKTAVVQKWNEIKTNVSKKVSLIKFAVTNAWENIKSKAEEIWDGIVSYIPNKIEQLKTDAKRKFEEVKKAISDIWEEIKDFFRDAISINFKLPTISMGKKVFDTKSIIGIDLGKIEIPWPNISWNAKAYNNPYMFTKPTVYGFGDGNGGEMVYGHDNLMRDIRAASDNSGVEERLDELIELFDEIVRNGLTANISSSAIYRSVTDTNRKRTRATNYNALASAY